MGLWRRIKQNKSCSLVQIEGSDHTFNKQYLCLRTCKECFKVGCRLVVGLEGYFIKFAQGEQLLAAIDIDGENCMFPIAWAVIDVENKTNWQSFIELLVEEI